jgi:hypothetical protein
MHSKVLFSVVLLVSAAFASLPTAGAAPCQFGGNPIHTFTLGGGAGAYTDHKEAARRGTASTRDSCTTMILIFDPLNPAAINFTIGDNDKDDGIGGGAFPAQSSCPVAAPSVPHHAGGKGAKYYATNLILPMEWSAGTDGGIPGISFRCLGDGIISNDYNTNPYDCASGVSGLTYGDHPFAEVQPNVFIPTDPPTPDPWASATNVNAECNGVDGFVWVFLAFGVSINGVFPIGVDTTTTPPTVTLSGTPGLSLSVPLQGTIYD